MVSVNSASLKFETISLAASLKVVSIRVDGAKVINVTEVAAFISGKWQHFESGRKILKEYKEDTAFIKNLKNHGFNLEMPR